MGSFFATCPFSPLQAVCVVREVELRKAEQVEWGMMLTALAVECTPHVQELERGLVSSSLRDSRPRTL